MKELSFEKMEELNGGLSFGCAFAIAGAGITLATISAFATPAAGVALALEASSIIFAAGGIGYGCAQELGIV